MNFLQNRERQRRPTAFPHLPAWEDAAVAAAATARLSAVETMAARGCCVRPILTHKGYTGSHYSKFAPSSKGYEEAFAAPGVLWFL